MKHSGLFAFLLCVFLSASPSNAACVQGKACTESPEERVQQRKAYFKSLGQSMKTIKQALKEKKVEELREAALMLQSRTPKLRSFFPKGTAVGIAKSQAKPEIWDEWARFEERASDLNDRADQFAQAAAIGDLKDITARLQTLGKACGACHQNFRK